MPAESRSSSAWLTRHDGAFGDVPFLLEMTRAVHEPADLPDDMMHPAESIERLLRSPQQRRLRNVYVDLASRCRYWHTF